MAGPDPLFWIRELGKQQLWRSTTLQALVRAFLRSDPVRRAEARRTLPGIEFEACLWAVLRSTDRRN